MTLVSAGTPAESRAFPDPPGILARGRAETIDLDDAAPLWPALAEMAASDNPFFDPGFLGPAAEGLGAEIETLAVKAQDGGLAGLLPLVAARVGRIAPALAVWVHEYGPLGTPVVADASTSETAAALIEGALERAGAARALLIPYLPVEGPIPAAVAAMAAADSRSVTRIDSHARAALDRTVDGTDPRQALRKRRRKEYTRQMRRLGEIGPVTIEHAIAPADIAKSFDEFLALETAGWKGRRGTAMTKRPEIAAFARRAIENLAPRGAASILTLRVGERPAAMLICLHQHRTALTWKIAYDETLARFSPGALLMLEAPSLLFANDRITRIDSCAAPNHPMVDHLWAGRLHLTSLVIGPRKDRLITRVGLATHTAESGLRGLAHGLLQTVRRSRQSH